jgi:hypothetical protein
MPLFITEYQRFNVILRFLAPPPFVKSKFFTYDSSIDFDGRFCSIPQAPAIRKTIYDAIRDAAENVGPPVPAKNADRLRPPPGKTGVERTPAVDRRRSGDGRRDAN